MKKSSSPNIITMSALAFLEVYKRVVSPLLGNRCRFHPSCSEYAAHSVAKHGLWQGLIFTIWRVVRCQPLCEGGFDPVPERGLNSQLGMIFSSCSDVVVAERCNDTHYASTNNSKSPLSDKTHS